MANQVAAAIRGGLRFVQLRRPDAAPGELAAELESLRPSLPSETVVVVNGDPALARAASIGLHLGAANPSIGRANGPTPRPYGRSVHNLDELETAQADGVDYVVVGTIFKTRSKPGRAGSGVELIRRITRQAGTLPVFAIGGIAASRVAPCLEAGAYGVAVCSALRESDEPRRAAASLLERL